MTIAIEFDGVIVENEYPAIGEEKAFAFDTLSRLQQDRHSLILWTRRSGKLLNEAVDFCTAHGITFYAVNKSYPEEVVDKSTPRKINGELYIEDRMVDQIPDWGAIYQMIKYQKHDAPFDPDISIQPRKGFLGSLFNK